MTKITYIKLKQTVALMFLLFAFSFFISTISVAQSTTDVDPVFSGKLKDRSPVKVDGKLLFYVSGISSYPSELRAATIVKRIKEAADNPSVIADSVKIISDEDVMKIYAGDVFIMNIYTVDSEQEGISQKMLTELIKRKTTETIYSYRLNRTRPVLLNKIFYGIAAFVVMIILIILFRWLLKLLTNALTRWIKSSVDKLENKSYRLIRSEQLWKILNMGFRSMRIIIFILFIIVFLEYILGLFPWTNSIAVTALELVVNPVKAIGTGILGYLPSLFFLIVIFLITRYLLKLIKLLFSGIKFGGIVIKNFYPEWAMPTFKILRILIIAFAIVVAYPYIPGSGSVAFKGVSVFLGVLVSLGSSSFIGNIIAGYSMVYRRAFKIGDRIEVDGKIGFVEEQKLLITRLRSHKNEEIIIPNSVLMNSHIINYSARESEKGLILHTSVGIGYETPWRLVDAMLLTAADRTEGILKEPVPFVLKKSLGDFAINYELNAYCKDVTEMFRYYNLLHQNILDLFNENNVQIMTPAYESDPAMPKVVSQDKLNTKLHEDDNLRAKK